MVLIKQSSSGHSIFFPIQTIQSLQSVFLLFLPKLSPWKMKFFVSSLKYFLLIYSIKFFNRFSKDSKLIAAALLDNTIKVYKVETMKFFLSLYGHKVFITFLKLYSFFFSFFLLKNNKNKKISFLFFQLILVMMEGC